jgi:hypothetical protein
VLSVVLADATAPKPAQQAFLRELRVCLLDIKSHKEVASRCPWSDTSALIGLTRETVLESLRGCWKTVCARGARCAILGGPSTSPLDRTHNFATVINL